MTALVAHPAIERCYLYRFFDAADRLLYVGITRAVGARFDAHRRGATWWADVVRCEFQVYSDRQAAEAAEALAILTERPIHNAARPTPGKVEKLRAATTRDETAEHLRIVAEFERLQRLVGEQYVRLVRLECDNQALAEVVESLRGRLRWAQADVKQSDALLAQLTAERAIARTLPAD